MNFKQFASWALNCDAEFDFNLLAREIFNLCKWIFCFAEFLLRNFKFNGSYKAPAVLRCLSHLLLLFFMSLETFEHKFTTQFLSEAEILGGDKFCRLLLVLLWCKFSGATSRTKAEEILACLVPLRWVSFWSVSRRVNLMWNRCNDVGNFQQSWIINEEDFDELELTTNDGKSWEKATLQYHKIN